MQRKNIQAFLKANVLALLLRSQLFLLELVCNMVLHYLNAFIHLCLHAWGSGSAMLPFQFPNVFISVALPGCHSSQPQSAFLFNNRRQSYYALRN